MIAAVAIGILLFGVVALAGSKASSLPVEVARRWSPRADWVVVAFLMFVCLVVVTT